MSSKNPTETKEMIQSATSFARKEVLRRIPSSSDDLTFATITSEANGRNTTILNTTVAQ